MIDLKLFCLTDKTRSKAIGQPWSDGEFTYATDAAIIVRVPRLSDVPENPNAPTSAVAARIFETATDGKWSALPEFTAPKYVTCENCGGGGNCDCPDCVDTHTCGICHGTGEKLEKLPSVKFGEQLVSPKYLALLATLPGVRLANAVETLKPLHFKFDGGEGRLMPMWE